MSARASCTWGDGPDVLVIIGPPSENLSGYGLFLHRNEESSFGLTAREARRFAAELITAASRAELMDIHVDIEVDEDKTPTQN